VWRPSSGTWFIKQSLINLNTQRQWGQRGDVPLRRRCRRRRPHGLDRVAARAAANGHRDLSLQLRERSLLPVRHARRHAAPQRLRRRRPRRPWALYRPGTATFFSLTSSSSFRDIDQPGAGQSRRHPARRQLRRRRQRPTSPSSTPRPASGSSTSPPPTSPRPSPSSGGSNGDVPLIGDYDGDGKSDITVFRSQTRGNGSSTSRAATHDPLAFTFGGPGFTPLAVTLMATARRT